MDVNGTRFQLIKGPADWAACSEENLPGEPSHVAWDRDEWLMLKPLLTLFPRSQREAALDPTTRRGAAVDQYGNWYWIASDRQRIFWLPSGGRRPSVYWSQTVEAPAPAAGSFGPAAPSTPPVAELAGLAITEHHYLVVGNITQRGLFRFDLHAGGEPYLLLFPDEVAFEPFDLAAAPGGGVWVLDRRNQTYWGLDRDFQVIGAASATGPADLSEPDFQPADGGAAPVHHAPPALRGFSLAAVNPTDPIAIEALPDGSVLILDSPPVYAAPNQAPTPSTLYRFKLDQLASQHPLEADVEVVTVGEETTTTHLAVVGHDVAYVPETQTLYVAEHDGKQVIAFAWDDRTTGAPLAVDLDYLPLHFYGRRALIAARGRVYYDVIARDPTRDAAVRWVPLQAIDDPRFARSAALLTPVFDGKERDCVWDRLLLDACIPSDTTVTISTRAQNDLALLASAPFLDEPPLYQRGAGAEIPYYDPFADLDAPSEAVGTWELLFQQARGRYLQIRLALRGNGRVTPRLRALRAYYPRFSYPRRYLPSVYLEDEVSAGFLERLLANPEGFFVDIEGKMRDVSVLFDPRSAPPDTLDWLASWVALMLDPLWAQLQAKRQQSNPVRKKPAPDRRRLVIRYAMRLYNRRGTPDGIRFALHLLLDPCLEERLQRFKTAAIQPDPSLREELAQLGLPYPSPVWSEEDYENLLHDYLLSPCRPSKIRLVERFLARDGRAVAAGDPTAAGGSSGSDTIQASAHRFSILIPEALSSDEEAMVRRIVQLEKPAHTLFDVRRYWDYFRAGEARLGLDTVLGEDSRFRPIVLGVHYLAEGYLAPAYPMDVRDRIISDRDRAGAVPAL